MTDSVRINNWLNFYSFDVMGDVGFNRSFDMINKGEEDALIKLLHESTGLMTIFSHIPWAMNLIMRTRAGAKPIREHMDWSQKVLEQRLKVQ